MRVFLCVSQCENAISHQPVLCACSFPGNNLLTIGSGKCLRLEETPNEIESTGTPRCKQDSYCRHNSLDC